MCYYYFEILLQDLIINKEVFECENLGDAIKYMSYKEQCVRELHSLSNKVSSRYYKIDTLQRVTSEKITNLETILKDISESRGKIVNSLSLIHQFIL